MKFLSSLLLFHLSKGESAYRSTCGTLFDTLPTDPDFDEAKSYSFPTGEFSDLNDFEWGRRRNGKGRKIGWNNKAKYIEVEPSCRMLGYKKQDFKRAEFKWTGNNVVENPEKPRMKSLKCECFENPTCENQYTFGNELQKGCPAPTCDVVETHVLDAWKHKDGDKFRYGFALKVIIPQRYWDSNGWSVLLRFNGAHVNSGSFQLWNASFFNFFRKESGLEVLIHQKFWTEYDLHDKHSFVIVAERLLSGQEPEVFFWDKREKQHSCFDKNMHASGTRSLGTEFEQAVKAKEGIKSAEDVSIVKMSAAGKVRVLK